MLTYSSFKLTLSCSFHLVLPCSHCIMRVYDALYVHLLLKPDVSNNKDELIQVIVPANVTIHKSAFTLKKTSMLWIHWYPIVLPQWPLAIQVQTMTWALDFTTSLSWVFPLTFSTEKTFSVIGDQTQVTPFKGSAESSCGEITVINYP